MKTSVVDRKEEMEKIRKRVREGYYVSEALTEVIAEKFLKQAVFWPTKPLTFKHD